MQIYNLYWVTAVEVEAAKVTVNLAAKVTIILTTKMIVSSRVSV